MKMSFNPKSVEKAIVILEKVQKMIGTLDWMRMRRTLYRIAPLIRGTSANSKAYYKRAKSDARLQKPRSLFVSVGGLISHLENDLDILR